MLDLDLKVHEAIWVATAIMTYEAFEENEEVTLEDIAFKQTDILKRTSLYTEKNIDNARISQWCNADHENNTYNYLRDVDGKRRLVYPGEFNSVKEFSEPIGSLIMILKEEDEEEVPFLTINQLNEFLTTDYANFIKSLPTQTVDFLKIIKHLISYENEKYVNPQKVEGEEQQYYLKIKESGQQAVAQLNKLSKILEKKYNLHCPAKSKWLTGGNDVVRGYLWNQIKYADKYNKPTSISIFADKRNERDDVRFRNRVIHESILFF